MWEDFQCLRSSLPLIQKAKHFTHSIRVTHFHFLPLGSQRYVSRQISRSGFRLFAFFTSPLLVLNRANAFLQLRKWADGALIPRLCDFLINILRMPSVVVINLRRFYFNQTSHWLIIDSQRQNVWSTLSANYRFPPRIPRC